MVGMMTNTDKVFYNCVKALKWTAKKTGTTYNQVNVAVFCVIWPAELPPVWWIDEL